MIIQCSNNFPHTRYYSGYILIQPFPFDFVFWKKKIQFKKQQIRAHHIHNKILLQIADHSILVALANMTHQARQHS